MIGALCNNVEHFSGLWATAQKNVRRCAQQRGRIATTQNSSTFFMILSLLSKGQFT
jgi:hypothetical protein